MRYSNVVMAVRTLFLVPMLLLAGVACFGGGGGADSPPAETPEPTSAAGVPGSPEQALARYVQQTLQKPFVEDCTRADVAVDVNKVCASFRGERDQQRAYVLGLTFSEFTEWVILEKQGSEWKVASTSALNADTAAIPGIPWPLRTGVDVVVAGAQPCLNVREGPALNQKAVDCISDGATIKLSAGPLVADGFQWWQVQGRAGWVAGDFLRSPDAAR